MELEEFLEKRRNKKFTIEDIYPLTIVGMRFGGKIIIFQCENDCDLITTAAEDEEVFYCIKEWLEENVFFPFGIGETINDAFKDFVRRNKE